MFLSITDTGPTAGGWTTRVYLPFASELVAVSYTADVTSTTRQGEVLINGAPASGFNFVFDTNHRITPTPVAVAAGDYIEVRGRAGVGAGAILGMMVHVNIRVKN